MTEPTLKELGYLRILAREVGEQTPRARASAQVQREIRRLAAKAELMRRVRDCLAGRAGVDQRPDSRTRVLFLSPERSNWTGAWTILRWNI